MMYMHLVPRIFSYEQGALWRLHIVTMTGKPRMVYGEWLGFGGVVISKLLNRFDLHWSLHSARRLYPQLDGDEELYTKPLQYMLSKVVPREVDPLSEIMVEHMKGTPQYKALEQQLMDRVSSELA